MLGGSLTTYSPMETLIRCRTLPKPGRLYARKGQMVNPRDVVAEANLLPQYTVLDFASAMGLSWEIAKEFLQRKEGEIINKDDLLAIYSQGLVERKLRAPCNGKIIFIEHGKIWIEKEALRTPLIAGYPGRVVDLIPDKGVMIKTQGAWVQGVWSNKQIGVGKIYNLGSNTDEKLSMKDLNENMRSHLLIARHCDSVGVFKKAMDLGLSGLVLASLSSKLLTYAMNMSIPLIVIEGFGVYSMNPKAYDILLSFNGREAVINGQGDPEGMRPEVFVPLQERQEVGGDESHNIKESQYDTHLFSGQIVRVILSGKHGRVGKLIKIYASPQKCSNGVQAPSAEVALNDQEHIIVPLANLDILSIRKENPS